MGNIDLYVRNDYTPRRAEYPADTTRKTAREPVLALPINSDRPTCTAGASIAGLFGEAVELRVQIIKARAKGD